MQSKHRNLVSEDEIGIFYSSGGTLVKLLWLDMLIQLIIRDHLLFWFVVLFPKVKKTNVLMLKLKKKNVAVIYSCIKNYFKYIGDGFIIFFLLKLIHIQFNFFVSWSNLLFLRKCILIQIRKQNHIFCQKVHVKWGVTKKIQK